MTWPDWLVILTLAVAFWGGYRNGVVRELISLLAVVLAWVLAGVLAGSVAGSFQLQFGLSPSAAHLAAFWFLFLVFFAATRAAGWLLERFTKLPLMRIASGVGGGFVACGKAVLALWFVLFIALFFPIARDVRTTLRKSATVSTIESLNRPAYAMIDQALPRSARPFERLVLDHHHL